MNITIIGAGGIGGVIGGYLERKRDNVTLVDLMEEHVNKMQQDGLEIKGNHESFIVPVKAITMNELLETKKPLELVFLCVKAQHTIEAVNMFTHLLTPASAVVSFQNGLCEQEIAKLIGEDRTIGCFVNFFSDYIEPGVIQYGGVGSLYIGELNGVISPRVENIVERLKVWGDAKVTDNIWGYLWGKLAYAAVLSATALTDETIADILEPEKNRKMLLDLASETLAMAHAKHVKPMGFDDWEPSLFYPVEIRDWEKINPQIDRLLLRLRSYTKTRSGMWRDMAVRKRKTEVPYQFSPVIRDGEAIGLDMSLTKAVVSMIKEVESGKRERSISNIEELHFIHQRKNL